MPGNILSTDVMFPQFSGGESNDEKLSKVMDYLVMLQEQLRYTLANLGTENFNETEIETFGEMISEPIFAKIEAQDGKIAQLSVTAEGLSSQVSDVSGNLSLLTQTVYGFKLSATNGAESSTLMLTSGGIALSSAEIKITGMVTFSALSGSGTTVINGDNIKTGTITGITITGTNYNMLAYQQSGATQGEIRMYLDEVRDGVAGNLVGGIRLDLLGSGTLSDARARVFIYTQELMGVPVGLKLQSSAETSITAPRIYLNGAVYVNGNLIS